MTVLSHGSWWMAVAWHKWWGQCVALGSTGHRPGDQHGPNSLKCTKLEHHPPKVQEGSRVSAALAPRSVGLAVEALRAAEGWAQARVRLAQLPSCLQLGSGVGGDPAWARTLDPGIRQESCLQRCGLPAGRGGSERRGHPGSRCRWELDLGCWGAQVPARQTRHLPSNLAASENMQRANLPPSCRAAPQSCPRRHPQRIHTMIFLLYLHENHQMLAS